VHEERNIVIIGTMADILLLEEEEDSTFEVTRVDWIL
jgi:hypothetical protein